MRLCFVSDFICRSRDVRFRAERWPDAADQKTYKKSALLWSVVTVQSAFASKPTLIIYRRENNMKVLLVFLVASVALVFAGYDNTAPYGHYAAGLIHV